MRPRDVEIERKYLLSGLPEAVANVRPVTIDQGWLPGERLQERIRRIRDASGESYTRTVKLGEGVERIQVEEAADRALFDALWPLTNGRRVSKLRYRVPDGDLVWEIDRFTDRELLLAEVELPDADFVPTLPAWLAPYVVREVSGVPEYVNVNLAR
jgi:CYTH domain-containing protein